MTDKIPASIESPQGLTKPKRWRVLSSPIFRTVAAGAVVFFFPTLVLLFLSVNIASHPSGAISDAQDFGICDSGGNADTMALSVALDELTTFAAMQSWAPEMDLAANTEQYTVMGRVQLDQCIIIAFVGPMGEYYGFILKVDEQGTYIVGMSRANLSEAPEDLPDKILTRPRQGNRND